jgi:hypothetical protein
VLGDPHCGGSNNVAIGFVNGVDLDCFNFAVGGDLSQTATMGTYINRPPGGQIHFREGNGPDQMTIFPGGAVAIAAPPNPNNTALTVSARYGSWAARLDGHVEITGVLQLDGLNVYGTTPLCREENTHIVATCSSSLRYKTEVRPFAGGLDIVNRLRPITFTWKQGGTPDVGLAAEDVEQVEPLLTFRNDKGEIEGVKYNQLSAVFVNAIKAQQAQIERQQVQIDALKGLVCQSHRDADVCQ